MTIHRYKFKSLFNMSGRTQVTIVPETITISVTGEACHLSLPRVHRSKSNIAPAKRIYESHSRFRLHAEPREGLAVEKLRKKADLEIGAIFSTFPDVVESNTVLAMAAWFYLLYTVDDLIEEMEDTIMAADALKKTSIIFQNRKLHKRSTIASQSTSSVSTGPLPSKHHPDYQSLLPNAVAYACKAFRDHVRLLIPEHTFQRLIAAITDVWQGMISEIQFRQQRRSSVAPYMQIRVRTIGLAPFFVLLRKHNAGSGEEDSCWSTESSLSSSSSSSQRCEHTNRLETCVKTAVGIQNDLVGLAKDLREGEHMNWVLLGLAKLNFSSASESESESEHGMPLAETEIVNSIIQAGADRAVEVHNAEVEKAYRHLEKMEDKEYGLMLVGFIEKHLRWAQMTARYKMATKKAMG